VYWILLIGGLVGFVLLSGLSFLHLGGDHSGHAGHHGLDTGHGHALDTGHHAFDAAHHAGVGHHAQVGPSSGHHGHHHDSAQHDASIMRYLLLSPLDVFSMALGAGAAGLIYSTVADPRWAWIPAIFGAIIFCFAIVRPLMRLGRRFESKPSEGLEGTIAQQAKAITSFDAQGRGLISISLDGQECQVLAFLTSGELQNGISVRKGDEVVILSVDSAKNLCTVTRQLS
jgi:hypothetical protein